MHSDPGFPERSENQARPLFRRTFSRCSLYPFPSRPAATIAMKSTKLESAQRWYLQHRRENFAASQRLEGIVHPVARDTSRPLPSKDELLGKYRTAGGA